ncbi:MAG: oligopeptide ABC transporter permease [Clostridium sp.]|uniref:oligopeptide ABC transporter permease n=1 Tax=Clostridium sp. TaxID=1506 RepID=UPI003F320FEE
MSKQIEKEELLNDDLNNLDDELFEFKKSDEHCEKITRESLTFWKDVKVRLFKNKAAIFGLIMIAIIVGTAIIAPMVSKYTYATQNEPLDKYGSLPPRIPIVESIPVIGKHFDGTKEIKDGKRVDVYEQRGLKDEYFFFGTDDLGRDVWVRVWYGVRISLIIALIAAAVDFLIGVTYGGISGYFGGRVDMIMQRISEVIAGIPGLVVIILFILAFEPGIFPIGMSIAITGWIGMSRIVRAQVMKLKEQEFVMAAKTLGVSDKKIILRHLIPNTVGQIVVMIMFTIPGAIFYEAFLAFIGLGLPAPSASLGVLVNDGFKVMSSNPYLLAIPAVVISVLMISFNMVADGLRDALDPKLRNK